MNFFEETAGRGKVLDILPVSLTGVNARAHHNNCASLEHFGSEQESDKAPISRGLPEHHEFGLWRRHPSWLL